MCSGPQELVPSRIRTIYHSSLSVPVAIKSWGGRFFLYLAGVFCYTRIVIVDSYRHKGVRPVKFKKWNLATPAEQDVALLQSAGYPYLLSTVLASRGIVTAEAAAEF